MEEEEDKYYDDFIDYKGRVKGDVAIVYLFL